MVQSQSSVSVSRRDTPVQYISDLCQIQYCASGIATTKIPELVPDTDIYFEPRCYSSLSQ